MRGITSESEPHVWADCHCPSCGFLHQKEVAQAHVESPDAWKIKGKLAILCMSCVPPPREYHHSIPVHKKSNLTVAGRSLSPQQKRAFLYSKGKVQRGY